METIQNIKKSIYIIIYTCCLYLAGGVFATAFFVQPLKAQQTNLQYDHDGGKLLYGNYLQYPFVGSPGSGTYTVKLKIPFHFDIFVAGSIDIQLINMGTGQQQTYATDQGASRFLAGTYLLRGHYLNPSTSPSAYEMGIIITETYDNSGLPPIVAPAPSQDQNYVIAYTPINGNFTATQLGGAAGEEMSQLRVAVNYYDGLGRPSQTVNVRSSSDFAKDIISANAHDAFGRETKKYLPYAASSNEGIFRADAVSPANGVWSFYNPAGSTGPTLPGGIARNSYPFAETRQENSPLNRMREQGAAGIDWQIGNGHTVRTNDLTNDAAGFNLGSGRWAKHYKVNIDVSGNRTLSDQGSYGQNQLYVNETKNENWSPVDGKAGVSQEYKDKEGRVVLKRIWKDDTTPLSTYYVYDDYGNLCYVLPPKADADSGLPTLSTISELVYQYQYDALQRMVAKKIPGKDWEYLVYNKSGQVVATQDGEQRLRNEWLVNKYDGLGRNIMTGLWISNISPADFRSQVYDDSFQWDVKAVAMSYGYDIRTYPQSLSTILTVSYFDNYDIPDLPTGYVRAGYCTQVQGLPTATRTAVLNNPAHMLWGLNYYDNEGRMVKNINQHYLGGVLVEGNYDEIDNSYNFINEQLTSTRIHKVNGVEQVKISTRNEYDRMGRLTKNWHQVNSAPEVLLAEHSYNDIGMLSAKALHNGLQTTNFSYNERGWLKGSNSTELDIALGYNSGTHPQYNGNITSQQYTNGSNNTFAYQYDKLNRLIKSEAGNNLGETISYDLGGNILSMAREGFGTNSYNSYTGNKLTGITGFTTGSFSHDANGNVKSDSYRNISNIIYNYLDLPQNIVAPVSINYVYDATGRKLRKISAGTTTSYTDYIDGIQYANGAIDFIQTAEGIAFNTGGGYVYHYNLADHLGNVRVTFRESSGAIEILQRDDYYAFGYRKSAPNGIGAISLQNKYLYNGKELQEELELYDYGARFYDPVIGRWHVMDPLAEKFYSLTPYHYVDNNPLTNIDPDGKDTYYGEDAQDMMRQLQAGSANDGPGDTEKGWLQMMMEFFGFGRKGPKDAQEASDQSDRRDALLSSNAETDEKMKNIEGIPVAGGLMKMSKGAMGTFSDGKDWGNVAKGGGEIFFDITGGAIFKNTFKYISKDILGHIFRNAVGHVNPTTIESKLRYLKLFENVANDVKNVNPAILSNYQKNTVGFQGFSQTFRSGQQVWVQVFNGKIVNAGVNIISK
ncbi:RHS repeat domain-containing protein [Pedobacter chitinilyticus]|uniref:RHS repeat-associated core domain-containing protein n=1 Tax=Pedobacter chitinilyticus TaxID=2233776 RepID=A0A443YQQ2_9SPHI|nr:DUF6443 domain-containing protein [Pedobacter chitinilyticus]RWU06138.1 RHS repeat-associated core domain-containing protein [Pedobacter chitinilyticus]